MAQFRKDTHQYLQDNKTLYEVVMLADQYGSLVGPANPSGMAVDAFGRARMSQPLTMFDSTHRYRDNGMWVTSNTATATYAFHANTGLINLNVDTTTNAEVIRETYKVFSYQPGKSLQILNTFVFNQPKTNLRQRVGYFGSQNGIFLEQDGTDIYFVKRSYITGTTVDTRVAQANWNIDTMLGAVPSSPSQLTLDLTKAQIMFTDIEWLGVGSVRCGFVVNGAFIHCHTFHHANLIATTYMTTASLPLRYEIKNTGTTSSSSTLKQICSTVISEGGYELRGTQQSIATTVTSPYSLATAGTFYPLVAIRLKSTALDAVVVLSALSFQGLGNNINFRWEIRMAPNGSVTTAAWTSAGTDSAVEYTTSGTAVAAGGRVLASGFVNSSTQGSPAVNMLKEALFRFQLERDGLSGTASELVFAVAAGTSTSTALASLDWEETSR